MKTASGSLLVLVLILTVGKQEKDIALLLEIAACCMVAFTAISLFRPVMEFLYRLEAIGNLTNCGLGILLKMVGIAIVSELIVSVCQDAGNTSLGKQVQLLATAVILNISLPLLETFFDTIERLMGDR